MSHSTLFHALRRVVSDARRPDDAPEEGVSRRDVLRGGLATVAATLVPKGVAGGSDPPRWRGERVVIVGAGTAGLVAAHRLRQAGVPADVYEASTRVGGRMSSSYGAFGMNEVLEWGGELVDSGHVRLRRLAGELGLRLTDLARADAGLREEEWFFGGRRYEHREMVALFRPVAAKIDAALERVTGETITYRAPNGAGPLDRQSIAEWLERAGVASPMREMLALAYTTEYGLDAGEQSALNLLWLITTAPGEFRAYGDSDERYHIAEGSGAVPVRLARSLQDRLHVGSALVAVRRTPAGRYALTFRDKLAERDVLADRVILALPFSTLRRVALRLDLPPVKRRAIAELGYGTNTKLFAAFRAPVWRASHGSSGSTFSDLPYQTSWDATRGQAVRGGVLVNYTGGAHGLTVGRGAPSEPAAAFVRSVERVYPGAAGAFTGGALRAFWAERPWSLGSYAAYKVGQWTAFAGAEGEAVEGLHFAGEHTSIDFQGYMEGAVESGERAAREVLASLGVRRSANA